MFVTSTPCASDDEQSDLEEEVDADDDPLYVPDLEDERDEVEDFADFDDCLYEWVTRKNNWSLNFDMHSFLSFSIFL